MVSTVVVDGFHSVCVFLDGFQYAVFQWFLNQRCSFFGDEKNSGQPK